MHYDSELNDIVPDEPYVDSRGVWPVYIDGQKALTIEHQKTSIAIEDAENILRAEGRIK